MQIEQISIALRARSAYEAMDLGFALVRQHASAIWLPWFCLTLPIFLACFGLAYVLDIVAFAPLFFWWLKPIFDRVPLFVLSRAVFGPAPDWRTSLREQRRFAPRELIQWLTWRRLSPNRAVLFPIHFLEGQAGKARSERTKVVLGAISSPSLLLTFLCINFELALVISAATLVVLFIPLEFIEQWGEGVFGMLFETPPLWFEAVQYLVFYLAMSIIEPFYIGAGFALYINRRTQLEAWDIELAFRSIAKRISAIGEPLIHRHAASSPATATTSSKNSQDFSKLDSRLRGNDESIVGNDESLVQDDESLVGNDKSLVEKDKSQGENGISLSNQSVLGAFIFLAFLLQINPALAKPNAKSNEPSYITEQVFGPTTPAQRAKISRLAKEVLNHDDFGKKKTISEWVERNPNKIVPQRNYGWANNIGNIFAFLAEYGLWVLIVSGLIYLLYRINRWLPWLQDRVPFLARARVRERFEEIDTVEPLPDHLTDAANALWLNGQTRSALALLYRGGLHELASRLNIALVPGTTEADALKRARALSDIDYQNYFRDLVGAWQNLAYAHRELSDSRWQDLLRQSRTQLEAKQ